MESFFDEKLKRIENALSAAMPSGLGGGLDKPCRDLLSRGGKRWRPLLLVLSAEAFCGTATDDIYALCPLVEGAHTASLIHDDIEDNSTTRRGQDAAHITYGTDTALNSASWLYFESARCIDRAVREDALRARLHSIYVEELCALHQGQALDIAWHKDESFFPTVEQYTEMTRGKTGALASLAARVGALAGSASEEDAARLGTAAVTLGVGFQMLDDARNIDGGNPGKQCGDDIVEGKKSLPLLLHLAAVPDDKARLVSLFRHARSQWEGDSAVSECVALLMQSGAAVSAHEMGVRMVRKAQDAMPTEDMKRFVDGLLEECNA